MKRGAPPSAGADPREQQVENLLGLGEFSARKSYYPELLFKIEELEREKSRYQWLFEHALHGIFQAHLGGRLQAANSAMASICGYASPRVMQDSIQDIRSELFADPTAHAALVADLAEAGATCSLETEFIGPGRRVPVALHLLMKDPSLGLVEGFVQDITEQRRAQQQLESLNRELELRVAKRTQALENSLGALKKTQQQLVEAEKLASLGGLVAGVSHEINTPLGNALTAVSLLRDELDELDALLTAGSMTRSRLESCLALSREASRSAATNLQTAADLITSFKRIAIDQSQAECRTFDLKDYLLEVIISLRGGLHSEGHAITFSAPVPVQVHADPGLFAQILNCLISNSLHHGFVAGESGLISIELQKSANSVTLTYRDNGQGIPAAILPQIFDPFFTTSRGRGATGLGLHIIYNVVAQGLRGTIRCDSEPGKGTGFVIRFPALPTDHLPA